jgi:hypothetical protein
VGRANTSPELISKITHALAQAGFTDYHWIEHPYDAPAETIISTTPNMSNLGGQLLAALATAVAPGKAAMELSNFQNVPLPDGHIQIFPAHCKA